MEQWGDESHVNQMQGLQEKDGISGGDGGVGKREHHVGHGEGELDGTPRATIAHSREKAAIGSQYLTEALGRRRRRRRAFSARSCRAGDARYTDDDKFGDEWEQGSEGDQRFISRVEVCERFECLRSEAGKVLAGRENERKAAEEEVAHLQEELCDSQHREAQTAARLEESRELDREHVRFAERVWQEGRGS